MTQLDTLDAPPLNPGFYGLTVTDDNGCVAMADSLVVVNFQSLEVMLPGNNINDVDCFGEMNGAIDINPVGGVPPYTFIWTNEAGDTISMEEDLNGLAAGMYSIELIDFNDCSFVLNDILVDQPEAPLGISIDVTDNFCYGYTEGAIDLTVSGGTTPYSFLWGGGEEDEDLVGLAAGYYDVTVTDANSCELTQDSIFVGQPLDSISIDTIIATDVFLLWRDGWND